jgi:hypothetical protein
VRTARIAITPQAIPATVAAPAMTNAIGIRPAGSAVYGLVMEDQGPRPRTV